MPHTIAASSSALLACDRANTVMHRATSATSTAYAHTPFGQHSPSTSDTPRSGFNGQHLERTGSYLLGNGYRAYNPSLRRFDTPDSLSPFGQGGLNAYVYCSGDPVNRRDPSGHDWQDIANGLAIAGGVAMTLLGGRKPIGKLLGRTSGGPVNKVLVGAGATATAFGVVGLVAPDDKFKTGMFIAAGATLLSPAVIAGYKQYAKLFKQTAKSARARSSSVEAANIDGTNASLGLRARSNMTYGTVTTTQTTTINTTFETVITPTTSEIAQQTAAIDIAVSQAAHKADVAGSSAYLRSLLPQQNSQVRR